MIQIETNRHKEFEFTMKGKQYPIEICSAKSTPFVTIAEYELDEELDEPLVSLLDSLLREGIILSYHGAPQ